MTRDSLLLSLVPYAFVLTLELPIPQKDVTATIYATEEHSCDRAREVLLKRLGSPAVTLTTDGVMYWKDGAMSKCMAVNAEAEASAPLAAPVAALQHEEIRQTLDWNTLILAAIGLVGTSVTGYIGYLTYRTRLTVQDARAEQIDVRADTVAAKDAALATTATVNAIHQDTNTERETMLRRLEALQTEVSTLHQRLAQRGTG
jgi:hypothetical protein